MSDEVERTPCGNRGGEQMCAADDPLTCATHWNLPDYHPAPRPAFTAEEKKAMMDMLMAQAENAPHMHEHDEAYWQNFLGGPLPDPSIMPQHWNGILQSVSQDSFVADVPVVLMIALIWDNDEQAEIDLANLVGSFCFFDGKPKFFKVGFRTCKDTFSVTAKNPGDMIAAIRQSERAMEEVAMAKARGWDTIPILTRQVIDSPSLDRTELRVQVEGRRVKRVSTAPYAFHTENMAMQLVKSAWPTLSLISAALPVSDAIIDVFYYDGAWWLCDVNPDLPTTWPGHFAYVNEKHWSGEVKDEYRYLAYSLPNPSTEFNKHCKVVVLPTGTHEFTRGW